MCSSDLTDDTIRPIARRLSIQRPWLSADENWYSALRALRQGPWRLWIIRFSGDKERSGWDWADFFLKVSIPILILGMSLAYNKINADHQTKIQSEQREDQVLTEYLREMNPLLVEKNLKLSPLGSEVRSVSRGLTLAALSQLSSPKRKTLAIRFLLDSGLNSKPGNLIALDGADLTGVNLSTSDLRLAKLNDAVLRNADLFAADMRMTSLRSADLSGATLREAFLDSSNLGDSNLTNSDLRGASMNGALLYSALLRKANLALAELIRADLRGADLSKANLEWSNLTGADLTGAKISGAKLYRTNLKASNLSMAELKGVDLSHADLRGANLQEVRWDKTTIWPQRDMLSHALNIPSDLRAQLGIE